MPTNNYRFNTQAIGLRGDPMQNRLRKADGSLKTNVNEGDLIQLWNRFVASANANPEGARAKWLATTRFGKEGIPEDAKIGTAILKNLRGTNLLGEAGSTTLDRLFRRKPPGSETSDGATGSDGSETTEVSPSPYVDPYADPATGSGGGIGERDNSDDRYANYAGYSNYNARPDRLQEALLTRANQGLEANPAANIENFNDFSFANRANRDRRRWSRDRYRQNRQGAF